MQIIDKIFIAVACAFLKFLISIAFQINASECNLWIIIFDQVSDA